MPSKLLDEIIKREWISDISQHFVRNAITYPLIHAEESDRRPKRKSINEIKIIKRNCVHILRGILWLGTHGTTTNLSVIVYHFWKHEPPYLTQDQ